MKKFNLLIVALLGAMCPAVQSAERPNILWLTAEDMSPHLGCYGAADARTPRIDDFARGAVRYTHAFATAPVCSPARCCLITGMYATSPGTQRLRSRFPVPAEFGPFTAHLCAAGYYCTNNVKTDYNLAEEPAFIRAAWDESSTQAHWRSRRKGQPFFAVFNFMTTHQSRTSVWPHEQFETEVAAQFAPKERRDPAELTLPPYYPDTAEARRAWARYHDCITAMDKQVGEILDQLAVDGLAEDTIVFFYSDHGMGLPRGKRCLYDSGLQVPLHRPLSGKMGASRPGKPGGTAAPAGKLRRLRPHHAEFVQCEGTVALPGHRVPRSGGCRPREFVYGARDRVDEAFDVARSVRDDRWLYIRNFMPHLAWMQPEAYSDASIFRRELKRLAKAGRLGTGPLTYAAPRRALEELYDTQADPHQLHNLAAAGEHRAILERLRHELRRWQLATRDAGFITEPQMWARLEGQATPWDVVHDETRYPLERLLQAADDVGRPEAARRQRECLQDHDDGIRYWAAVGLNARLELSEIDRHASRGASRGSFARSARRVGRRSGCAMARRSAALPVLAAALRDRSSEVVLHAARALELLGPIAQPADAGMRIALAAARQQEARGDDIAMFIRFSLEAALAE